MSLKNILSFNSIGLFLFCFVFNFNALGQVGHHTCGFEPTEADLQYMREHIMNAPSHLLAKSDDPICLPIQIHAVRIGQAQLSANGLSRALANMNHFYKDAGISFFWKSPPIYVENVDFFNFVNQPGTTEDDLVNLFNPEMDAINFYFVYSINGGGIAGYAYLPNNTTTSNRIVMRTDQIIDINNKTFLHELGHYFSLLHTFSGNLNPIVEAVVRTGPDANCADAADTFCDTEADPGYNAALFNLATCTYTGAQTDFLGELYTPPVENIMSYFHGFCTEDFTPEQYGRIAQGVATRMSHTAYSFDAEPMNVAAPTNLTAVTVDNVVTLEWTDNADNEMGYIVERSNESANSGFRVLSNTGIGPNGTTLNAGQFNEDEVYWFRVKATNAGCGVYSNTVFLGGGINLDVNNSSQAGGNDFNGGTHCAPVEVFIADTDVNLIGSALDVVLKIRLVAPQDGAREFLQAPQVEGVTIQGNGTANLSVSNTGGLSTEEIEGIIAQTQYVHTGETVTPGTRTIEFFRASGNSQSPKSFTTIEIGRAVDAGQGGSFTACPDGIATWSILTPEAATAGGRWYTSANVQLAGSLNQDNFPGTFIYKVGDSFCENSSTYDISFVLPPSLEISTSTPYCETQCTGSIAATTSNGFDLYANDDLFNGQISNLCEGEYIVTSTNGEGCSRSKNIVFRYEYTNDAEGMPYVMCTSEPTRFSDYIGLSGNALLILNGGAVAPNQATQLINNQTYNLTVYDFDNCIDRGFEFLTENCPTKNTDVIFIPNAFSPNGDGINDLFKVVSQYDLEFYEIHIFDRLGAQVFASTDQNQGWNGSHNGGDYYLPPGICTYILRYQLPRDLETRTVTGTINILR